MMSLQRNAVRETSSCSVISEALLAHGFEFAPSCDTILRLFKFRVEIGDNFCGSYQRVLFGWEQEHARLFSESPGLDEWNIEVFSA